ncbi:MAG: IS1 family transposase [Anaerolineae bacterium]|nr:IS1 family transposase [Anaerolineae bacterium]
MVTDELSAQSMQKLIDSAPQMTTYCTDGHSVYQELNYRGGGHVVAPGKSQTYAVEGNNAELRHYLKRLGRQTRCFTRKAEHLELWMWLFASCWNQACLARRKYPRYRFYPRDFVSTFV